MKKSHNVYLCAGMSTFHSVKRRGLHPFFRFKNRLTLAAFVLIQAILYFFLFSPSIVVIHEDQKEPVFLSTDLCDPIRNSLHHSISHAKESVLLITYTLSDAKIIGALRTASKAGAKVSVIYDAKAAAETPTLLGRRIACYPRKSRGLMHHKLLVVDHKICWIGSTNMTTTSLLQHGNLTVAFTSTSLAKEIEDYASSIISNTLFHSSPLVITTPKQRLFFYLHPGTGKQSLASLATRIDAATKRVFVAMYTFTHKTLYQALCRAKERGVDVRVLFDRDSLRQTSRETLMQCRRANIQCGFRSRQGLFHYKVALIDDAIVTGSCNWTKAGFSANDDCVCILEPLTTDQAAWAKKWWDTVEREATPVLGIPKTTADEQ